MGEMIPLRQVVPAAPAVAVASPAEIDQKLKAALPAAVIDALRPIYSEGGERIGYTLAGTIPDHDLAAAKALVRRSLLPADEATIKIELARLRASTKARAETQATATMILQVVAEQAAKFPRDVMIDAFRSWAEREPWFPSVAEIRAELAWRARYRFHLHNALDQRAAAPVAEPDHSPPSEEDKAYVDEAVKKALAALRM